MLIFFFLLVIVIGVVDILFKWNVIIGNFGKV